MKKIISLLLSTSMLFLVGCGDNYTALSEDQETFSIVCTIFPSYDWAKNITLGNDKVDVTFLLDNGIDLHNFQPSVSDIVTIQNSDLFIYVGGDSDVWVEDIISKDMNTLNLVDKLGKRIVEIEHIEGMEITDTDEVSDCGHSHVDDEHVWLSLLNSEILVEEITKALVTIDPTNTDLYTSNSVEYISKISSLENEFETLTSNSENKTLLFADRFPFRYMIEDYDLEYFAAFSGCSSESEVSFDTVKFLTDKTDELSLSYISTIEGSVNNISETIISNTKTENQAIVFESMQSVTKEQIESGATYLDYMKINLDMLSIALSN